MSISVNLSSLRSEFSSDPSGLGYATFRGSNHSRLVYLVNTASVNSNSTNSYVSVGMVYAINLQQCVVASEYSALTTTQKDLWQAMVTTAVQGMAISSTTIMAQISNIWSGTTTGASISALRRRQASRAEVLFGEGATVNVNEAAKADAGDF